MNCHQRPMTRVVFFLCVSMGLAACQSEPEKPAQRPMPTMRQMDERVKAQRDASQSSATVPSSARPASVGLAIERLEFLQNVSLENFWRAAEQAGEKPNSTWLWERNDLRVLVLDAQALDKLAAKLPQSLSRQRQLLELQQIIFGASSLQLVDVPDAFPAGSVLESATNCDLWISLEHKEPLIVRPGSLQFLVRYEKQTDARANVGSLELTPHCYAPRNTVRVRSQAERALDGQIFKTLTTRINIQANAFMLVSVNPRALPPPEVPASQPATQPTTTTASPEKVASSQPALPLSPGGAGSPGFPGAVVAKPRSHSFSNSRNVIRSTPKIQAETTTQPAMNVAIESTPVATQPLLPATAPSNQVLVSPVATTQPREEVLPPTLGQLMLTGHRFGRPVQVLLIIGISEQKN